MKKIKFEQVVIYFKNNKTTFLDLEEVKIVSENKIRIKQKSDEYCKSTIINFNNIDSVELLYKEIEE